MGVRLHASRDGMLRVQIEQVLNADQVPKQQFEAHAAYSRFFCTSLLLLFIFDLEFEVRI